jgi:hypothetical protein
MKRNSAGTYKFRHPRLQKNAASSLQHMPIPDCPETAGQEDCPCWLKIILTKDTAEN